jgi:hypothetical protein
MRQVTVLTVFLFALLSCKNPDKIPKDVLSENKMEVLLIDIHTFESGLMVMPNAISAKEGYAAIFKKHGITALQYEKSMLFYQEKPHLLQKIYSAVRDTFEQRMNK